MNTINDKAKILFLIILIAFIAGSGLLWMDNIGLIDVYSYIDGFKTGPESVNNATDDEPSLVEREEFEKEKQLLSERIETLDMREAKISELEKKYEAEMEKLGEKKNGLIIEMKKFEDEKKNNSGYQKNIVQLAGKITSMPPESSVKIMVLWEDPLVIDVLRQIDLDAESQGKSSISSYLITLMPEDKASRIMYLMTQL